MKMGEENGADAFGVWLCLKHTHKISEVCCSTSSLYYSKPVKYIVYAAYYSGNP